MSYIIKNNKCIARTINAELVNGAKIKYAPSGINFESEEDFDSNVQYAKISNAKKWGKYCTKHVIDSAVLLSGSYLRRHDPVARFNGHLRDETYIEFAVDTNKRLLDKITNADLRPDTRMFDCKTIASRLGE